MATASVQLPRYFKNLSFSIGFLPYGTLSVKGAELSYRYNDGSSPYAAKQETRAFGTESAAIRFASRFGAEMRRADSRNAVPDMGTFRDF